MVRREKSQKVDLGKDRRMESERVGNLKEWMTAMERSEKYKKRKDIADRERVREEDARKKIKKRKRERRSIEEEKGQGWRLDQWRGERAKVNRRYKEMKWE